MAYKIKKSSLPLRAPETLSRDKPDPATPAPWDTPAPGLYPDETVLDLDGEDVAVSVEEDWLETGGAVFHAYARWLTINGQTAQTPSGKAVETSFSWTVDSATLLLFGFDALRRDALLTVIGEPPRLYAAEDGAPAEPGADGARPLLEQRPELRDPCNIRKAIEAVKQVRNPPLPEALL